MKTLGIIVSLFILVILSSDVESQIFRRRAAGFSGGCSTSYCPPPYYAPTYVAPYVAPVVVSRPNTSAYVPTVYDDLDTAFLKIADHQQRHQFFLEKLQALGLHRNYANNIYGNYGVQNQAQNYGVLGTAGNTVYGTSVQQLYTSYGSMPDVAALYLQSNQLVRDARDLHAQGLNGHQALVAQAGQNQVRLMEILARSEAAARILQNLEVPKQTLNTTVNQFSNIPNVVPNGNGLNQQNSQITDKASVRLLLCGQCHSGNRIEGGLDITQFDSFSAVQKSLIMARLVTNDASKRMPRTPDGGSKVLTLEALEYFK